MILINHRVNSISKLLKTSVEFGVEADLRSEDKKIYLHHDPFKKGESFEKWVKYYKHKILILNVKEEGLEDMIIKILKKNKIKNFFFHDQTFSTLLKNMFKTRVSIRFSEYEDLKRKNYLFKKIRWLWLDNFNHIELSKKFYAYLKNKKVKICMVSPELIKKKRQNEIKKIINNLKKNKFNLDAVCTKKPKLWRALLNEK